MDLIYLLFVLAFIGLVTWALVTYIAKIQAIKTLIIIVAVIACTLIVIRAMGIKIPHVSVPQIQ